MFMRVVAPLNIAKSQGFSIILNWSTILDIMYGKIIPLPSTPSQGGENGTFGLLHGFIVDLGGMGGGGILFKIVVSFAAGGTSS